MRTVPKISVALIAVTLLVAGCSSDPEPGRSAHDDPCDVTRERPHLDGEVVIRGMDAPCELAFQQVARLTGELDGVAPRPPVSVGPDSTFLTATFAPGQLAVWSWDGDLLRTFGRGAGNGPGEFRSAEDIAIGGDGIVTVAADLGLWHRYTFAGAFIETVRVPATVDATRVEIHSDGSLVVRMRSASRSFLKFDGETFDSIGPAPDAPGLGGISVAGDRIWRWDVRRYSIRSHAADSGERLSSLTRDVPWYPNPMDLSTPPDDANLYGIAATDEGLIFVQVGLQAEGALSELQLTGDLEADLPALSAVRDNVVEVLGADGTLLASRRYDNVGEAPDPITADLWFRVERDLLQSITILQPVLSVREP